MIESIDYFETSIPLKRVFRTFLGSTSAYGGFLVRIRTVEGFEGWGEAIPARRITGETAGSIGSFLDMMKQKLAGMDELRMEAIWEMMEREAIGSYGAKCAVDTAIWDIIGRKANLPLSSMLGGYREKVETSFTVDLGSVEEAEEQISEYLGMGVRSLKVKLGRGLQDDYECVKKARQMGGSEVTVCVDFNQSYTPKKALELSSSIHKFEVDFLEQPVKASDLEGLKYVRDRSQIPVMADESVHGPGDALRIVRMEAADMLNLKLVKAGGITRGLRVIDIAESAGMPVMIGCTVETKVGITAAVHVALARRIVNYTDLDGCYSLTRDVAEGGAVLNAGMHTAAGPGLGLTLKGVS